VTFTNTSREGYEESFWDFGDGKTSRREHPIHTYRSAGVYTVTLAVSALGGSDVITRSQYIAVAEDIQPVQGDYSLLMPLVLRSR
jgi:PKD repeat protein